MKSTILAFLFIAGLSLNSCDYFESNDDNTYLNKTGEVKIINETSVKVRYSIMNPEDVNVTGSIDSHTKTDINLIPGFKWVTVLNDATNDTFTNMLTSVGVQADKKHSLYLTSYSVSKAATGSLPARDSVIAQMALLDNFYTFTDTTTKLRVINANRSSNLAAVYIAPNGADPLVNAPAFSNVGFATFDISYATYKNGNYSIAVVNADNSTITSSFTFEAQSGYSIIIKQDGTIEALKDN
ncbi:MAG: hypothetical protein GW823_00680 [Bacteroidetes bacterium]|nr:hypothetical protein [Bacteroidota bacterium]